GDGQGGVRGHLAALPAPLGVQRLQGGGLELHQLPADADQGSGYAGARPSRGLRRYRPRQGPRRPEVGPGRGRETHARRPDRRQGRGHRGRGHPAREAGPVQRAALVHRRALEGGPSSGQRRLTAGALHTSGDLDQGGGMPNRFLAVPLLVPPPPSAPPDTKKPPPPPPPAPPVAAVAPATAADAGTHGVARTGMAPSVAPGDDFFLYANGTWLKDTETPADSSRW